jgi:hypothetical protein
MQQSTLQSPSAFPGAPCCVPSVLSAVSCSWDSTRNSKPQPTSHVAANLRAHQHTSAHCAACCVSAVHVSLLYISCCTCVPAVHILLYMCPCCTYPAVHVSLLCVSLLYMRPCYTYPCCTCAPCCVPQAAQAWSTAIGEVLCSRGNWRRVALRQMSGILALVYAR